MTCRDEILEAVRGLTIGRAEGTFTVAEVVARMQKAGTRYTQGTIETHLMSRMCANAPDHHGRVYEDLERVGRGRYRLRGG